MKKIILVIIPVLLLVSCKPYNINYDYEQMTDYQKARIDTSAQPYALCVIFEKSMKNNKVQIQDFNSEEVFYNGILGESDLIGVSEILFLPNNPQNYIMYINDDLHYIESQIYDKHRYLVIYKPNIRREKYILHYTNNVRYRNLFDRAKP